MKDLRTNSLIILVIITVICGIVYFNSMSNPLQFDDEYYVSGNTAIRDTANIKEIFLHPKLLIRSGMPTGHYRPLVFISYALNYYFNNLNPAGYHLVNLAFHIGTAFLIFLIMQELLKKTSDVTTQYQPVIYAPLIAAIIFAVHPFNAEIVNFITARSSVMSGFFYLLAFWCWIRFRRQKSHYPSPIPHYYYIASIIAFLLGMLSKEVTITLPVVLWLYDLYFVPVKTKSGHVKRLIAYLPYVLLVGIPYIILRVFFWGAVVPHFKRDLSVQLYTEMPVLLKYLQLMFFPVGLSIDHSVKIYENFFTFPVMGSYMLLTALFVFAVWLYSNKQHEWRVISFFTIWFFIVLSPTTIFPLNTILQENRGYMAVVSIAVFAGLLLGRMLQRSLGVKLPVVIAGILIIILSAGTIYRNSVWKDGMSLWSDAIAKGSDSLISYTYLTKGYITKGDYEKGEEVLKKFLKQYPADPILHFNLSTVYYKTKRYEEALKEATLALNRFTPPSVVYSRIGLIYYSMGDSGKSIENYKKAVEISPDYMGAHFEMGIVYEKYGRPDLAAAEYRRIIKRPMLDQNIAAAAAQRLNRLEENVK